MNERYTEIMFYYYIKKLFAKFRNSIYVVDIIDAYCNIGNIDSVIIKRLIKDIRKDQGVICTYTDEAVYVGRQIGKSYRVLKQETGVSIATQLKIKQDIQEHPEKYRNIERRTTDEEYLAISRFMLVVLILKEL